MEKEFKSLEDLAKHFTNLAKTEKSRLEKGLIKIAKVIQIDAKKQIGHLQPEVGPFAEWPELADSTKAEKERLGYGDESNDWQPLLRTGFLRDSIVYEIDKDKLEAIIGSKYLIAAFQEFGTSRIPPRPFLGPAAFKAHDKIRKILGAVIINGIASGNVIKEDLGRETGYYQEIDV